MRGKAVLLVLDGTLAGTAAARLEAHLSALAAEGVRHETKRFLDEVDSRNRRLTGVLQVHGRSDRLETIRNERDTRCEPALRGRALWRPGARRLLARLAGDQPVDVIAARRAGMTSVLGRGEWTPADAAKPDHEADGPAGLADPLGLPAPPRAPC